jgi:dephospho-CoA kinase
MNVLAIVIAKSGVALLDLLPAEWEVVVADYSRLDQRLVQWWSYPSRKAYDEIIIVDQNITTGLTQLKLERELRKLGIEGPVRFAGNPKSLLGYRHMHYLLTKEGIVPKPGGEPPSDVYRLNRYMVALVGLPASGKTLLRHLFSRLAGFSCYKWGNYLRAAAEESFGPMTYENGWDLACRFTDEVESRDKVVVAKKFIAASRVREDSAPFVVVDGVKSREQLIYTSYALRRPVIVVAVKRDEAERRAEAAKRGDFDDVNDAERLEVLRRMGAVEVVEFADFVVETTGCATLYDDATRSCRIRFTAQFLRGMHDVLSWIYISDSLETTAKLLCNAAQEVAQGRGYAVTVQKGG